METGTHSIWVSEQLRELGHEVIVANVRELRAISHSDRKSDTVDAEKIALGRPHATSCPEAR
jgi:transposase